MVIMCTISTSCTKGARRINASTRVSGSAQPGWMYTRIPDCTHRNASSEVRNFFLYSISHDISSSPNEQRQVPLASDLSCNARDLLPHSKLRDQKTDRVTATSPARQRPPSDAPSRILS